MKYERYTFLEFFDLETTDENNSDIIIYSVQTEYYITSIILFLREQKISISVVYTKTHHEICQFDIHAIDELKVSKQELLCYQKEWWHPVLRIQLKPQFLFSYSDV